MLLGYSYHDTHSSMVANWTNENDLSCVYQDIVRKLIAAHGEVFRGYYDIAKDIDIKVDKLYRQIYIYTDERHALPYNPKDRKLFIHAFSEICDAVAQSIDTERSEEDRVIALLFLSVLDKLQETTGIFLLDISYHSKHLYRRRELEYWAETTPESKMSYEFEDVLLQLTELSSVLSRLTEKERRRLVSHVFLKYTFQEIADAEGVKKQAVEKSVSKALQKIRNTFDRS